jgi:hypothetical protein
MSRISTILDAIPLVHISAEMVTEVTSNLLLYFLVGTAVAAATTTLICSSFAPTMSVVSAVLVYVACAPLVGVTPPALVMGVRCHLSSRGCTL